MFSPLPRSLGKVIIDCPEYVYHMYMPIKMANGPDVRIPQHLQCFWHIVERVLYLGGAKGKYVYLSVKKMHVAAGQTANRPGWHIDGYGTDDTNFIWSDCLPTEFVTGEFQLSDDHAVSLAQMQEQANGRMVHSFGNCELLMLEADSVHRVALCEQDCVRTFVKVSLSTERYNLKGNARNYLFDYDWPMVDRLAQRNHPVA